MSVPAYITLTTDRAQVEVGGQATLTAFITNTGAQVAEFSLRPRGIEPAWLTLRPPTVTAAPGEQVTASVVVNVPADAVFADLTVSILLIARATGSPVGEASVPLRVLGSAPPTATATHAAPVAASHGRLPWVLGIAVVGVLLLGTLGFFLLRGRGGNDDLPGQTGPVGDACAGLAGKVVSLFSDDTMTAIRLSNPDLSDMQILRTERADVMPGLYAPLLALSGDNSRLAYVTAANEAMDDAHLWSIDVANPGQRTQLAAIPRGFWPVRPAWSPDNRQLAFLQLDPQKAAQNQTQLQLWIAEIGGQAHKIDVPPNLLQPEDFARNPTLPLCWAADNKTVIFQNAVRTVETGDQGRRGPTAVSTAARRPGELGTAGSGSVTSATGTIPGAIRQTEIDVTSGTTRSPLRPAQPFPPVPVDAPPPPQPSGTTCSMPAFSQNDPSWRNVIMQAAGDSIGNFGCAVTSTAMVLNYYGADINPPRLNQCLGQGADLLYWTQAVPCAKGAVTGYNGFDFSWQNLDQVLSKGKPAIVGMIRGQTGMHFVVVTAGSGGSASNYAVTDPWDGTTNKSLQTFIGSGYNMRWIRTYDGKDSGCTRITGSLTPAENDRGISSTDGGRPLAPSQLMRFFTKAAERTGVPREILLAIGRIESNFTPRAQGPLIERFAGTEDAHALGMMQFLPSTYRGLVPDVDGATGRSMGKDGIYDPESAIYASGFYLRNAGAPGDLRHAIFAYNNADWYVDQVLALAKQYAGGVILDDNIYDPNGSNKPGTRSDPNIITPLNPAGATPGAGTGTTGTATKVVGTPGKLSTVTPRARPSGTVSPTARITGGTGTARSGTLPPKPQWVWSIADGSVTNGPVTLDVSWFGDIGDVIYARILTLTLSGNGAGPVPVQDFAPGMTISAEGIYQVMIVTQRDGQIETTTRKFTIDHTAPMLDLSLANPAAPETARGVTLFDAAPQRFAAATRPQSRGPAKVNIQYEDRLSGVAIIEYQLDGSDWQLYFSDVNFKPNKVVDVPGDHKISFRATDLAGNASAVRTFDFTVAPDTGAATPTPSPATPTPLAPSATPIPGATETPTATPGPPTATPAPTATLAPGQPSPTPAPATATPLPAARPEPSTPLAPPAPPAPTVTLAPGEPSPTPAPATATPLPSATPVPTATVNPTAIRGPATLKLPGDITADATARNGVNVTYAVSASDNATVTCSPASGTLFPVGVTTVNCAAKDASGSTTTGSFTVTVTFHDAVPPTLKLPGDLTFEGNTKGGATVTFAVSALDAVDGDVPVRCSPASGSVFKLGTTAVNCSARDTSGNVANGSFNVIVRDTQPPVLALPGDLTATSTGDYTAAVVSYTASATDAVDGTVPASCAPASGSSFKVGTTTVNCTAKDAAGNVQAGSFRVIVQNGRPRDTTPPVLTLPKNISITARSAPATVTYTATAYDAVDGAVPVSCTPPSGSNFNYGTTPVTCSARDSSGNVATGRFTVTVDSYVG